MSVQVLCIGCSELSFFVYMGIGMCLFAYKSFQRDKKKEFGQ